MREFVAYAACVPWASNSTDPQMRAFFKWQVERVIKLSGPLDKWGDDTRQLKAFLRTYCSANWTKLNFGF
jgi:hypothetical protein